MDTGINKFGIIYVASGDEGYARGQLFFLFGYMWGWWWRSSAPPGGVMVKDVALMEESGVVVVVVHPL